MMPIEPARYTCYRVAGPIAVDGRLDERSWRAAPKSTPFVDIVTGAPAWFDTRVALLWDDEYLYIGFTAEETEVRASLSERDSKIYEENDLEVFIAGQDAYYEFEINARNTIYEAFWIWEDKVREYLKSIQQYETFQNTRALRDGLETLGMTLSGTSRGNEHGSLRWQRRGSEHVWHLSEADRHRAGANIMMIEGVGGHVHPRGKRFGFLDWDFPGVQHGIHVDGTLNMRTGTDKGWTAEIAFPWKGMELLADGRSLPPQDGDVWRIDCSRFQHYRPNGERIDPPAGWTWNRHGHYDSHIPDTFPFVYFSSDAVDRC